MAEVGRAERLLLVPVEGEGAQGPLQVLGEGEVVGKSGRGRALACAGGAAGGLQSADGVVGAERAGQSAAFAGEFGEGVEPAGEGGLVAALARVVLGAESGGEPAVGLDEAAPLVASVGPAGGAVLAERGASEEALGGGGRVGAAEVGGAGEAGVRREGRRRAGPAEGVEVELVLSEPAYEPFAPASGLTGGVRVATLREQSDPHACTPDLP